MSRCRAAPELENTFHVTSSLMRTAETTAAALMTEASGGIGTVYAIPERWALQEVEQRIRPISGGTAGYGKGHHDQ